MKIIISKMVKFVFLLSVFCNLQYGFGQSPQKMSYQTVIRNTSNDLIEKSNVGIKISIVQTSPSGPVVFSEEHTATTNLNGLATIEIGGGRVLKGNFETINWEEGPYFIKTETDPKGGKDYTIAGTSQLLSVPFALYAANSGGNGNGWKVKGNSGTNPRKNFIGTTDDNDFIFRRNNARAGKIGIENTSFGVNALNPLTTGLFNTAYGVNSLYSNTTGTLNTANGNDALYSNTTGFFNTANGFRALFSNTIGYGNTAIGTNSLYSNTTGMSNTASGLNSLYSNTTGSYNTAYGDATLPVNTTGDYNTANGSFTLYINSTGSHNTASGSYALMLNQGNYNTANGSYALNYNGAGTYNTATGYEALSHNQTGNKNTAIGYMALGGLFGVSQGSNNIGIGNNAQVPQSDFNNQVRIGDTNIAYAGIQVPWSITSDKIWKNQIEKSNLGLDFISKLNPVSYYRNNVISKKTEYGFIAQEVEEALNTAGAVNNGMITKDDKGMYSLRYNDFIAPMVKAIQEQQKIIVQEQEKNKELQRAIKILEQRLKTIEENLNK